MKFNKMKKYKILVLGVIIIYISVYFILSCLGNYVWLGSGVRVAEWQPKLIVIHLQVKVPSIQGFKPQKSKLIIKANTLGYLYLPLVMLDHKIFHKTKIVMEN